MLPNLLSLTIGMRSDDEADETEEFGETMDASLTSPQITPRLRCLRVAPQACRIGCRKTLPILFLPNLLSLTIGMRSDDEADETEEFGETMDAWLAER
jgi:hypothetical protein